MQHRVLFVGGGLWQQAFVRYLKQRGCYVAIVNPVENATTRLADRLICEDINNLTEIERQLPSVWPDIITSDQSDAAVPIVAHLNNIWASRAPVRFNPAEVIQRFTDKAYMCEFAKQIGMPIPATSLVSTVADLRFFGEHMGFPIIIKPCDSTMSRGFRKLETLDDVNAEALQAARRYSKANRVLTQTFADGDMVTLEGACLNGRHRTLAVSRKEGFYKPGINTGVRYGNHGLPDTLLRQLTEANDRYCHEAGLRFGLTHSEYILTAQGFVLIEIAARGGGAGITDKIVPWVTGINPYDILYAGLCDAPLDVDNLEITTRPALLRYYQAEAIRVSEQDRKSLPPGVLDLQVNFIGKQYIQDSYDTRHTMAIYGGENEDDLNRVVRDTESWLLH